MLSKDYGFTSEELDAVLEKPLGEMTEDESKIFFTYSTELAAHETEIALGNEQFIDRIVMEDEGTARKLVSKLLTLDKAFSSLKDKNARAQAKLIKEAEKLYLKAAENSGNAYIKKMILAHRPELEEELTRINAEKMQVGGNGVQMDMKEGATTQITAEMSDSERASVLKDRTILAPIYEGQADTVIAENEKQLNSNKIEFARDAILKIAKKLDIIGQQINFNDVDVQIQLSKSNLKESVVKDATPKQIAKLLPILSRVAEESVVIERHNNRYYFDTDTTYFDNLLGAYIDGENIIPVRFGLKHSRNGMTTLYVLVDQNEIAIEKISEIKEDRGLQDASPDLTESNYLHRSVNYSIAQIIPFVNSKDLLRYIPDDFLNNEQIEAKKKAVAETEKYTDEKNDKKYSTYVGKGLDTAAKQMLSSKAKAEGYEIDRDTNKAYKASDDSIKTLDVTYDDEGNLIPITKRYDSSKKDIRFNLKEKKYDLGDFFADEKDSGQVYKVSGGKVRKVIADNTRMKVYTRAESEAIINQIVSEQLSFGELYGSLAGKSRNEVIDILWNGLNSADVGERGGVALDVAEYIINHASVESIYDGEGLEVYTETVDALKPYLRKLDLSSIKGDIKHVFGKDSSPYLLWQKRRGEVGMTPDQVAEELKNTIKREDPISYKIGSFFIFDLYFFRAISSHTTPMANASFRPFFLPCFMILLGSLESMI